MLDRPNRWSAAPWMSFVRSTGKHSVPARASSVSAACSNKDCRSELDARCPNSSRNCGCARSSRAWHRERRAVDMPDAVPDLLIDRLRIQHVLYALAQNAVDAGRQLSSAPSIRIDVSSDRYVVETGISDSGPGVPADLQHQLFRPFFTTKPQAPVLGSLRAAQSWKRMRARWI